MGLPELLVVVAVMGIALGAAALYLKPAEAPLQLAAELLEGYFRQARFKAMANTTAYRVSVDGAGDLKSEFANSCSATTWKENTTMGLELPDGVGMTDTTWSVCFSPRGVSNTNVTVTLTHADYGKKSVEVLLGGTTQVL